MFQAPVILIRQFIYQFSNYQLFHSQMECAIISYVEMSSLRK